MKNNTLQPPSLSKSPYRRACSSSSRDRRGAKAYLRKDVITGSLMSLWLVTSRAAARGN